MATTGSVNIKVGAIDKASPKITGIVNKLKSLKIPALKFPKLSNIKLPPLKFPAIKPPKFPKFSNIKLPALKFPALKPPKFPKIKLPGINLGGAQKQLNSLNLRQAAQNIARGVTSSQAKINTLNAGNGPNKIATAFEKSFARVRKQVDLFHKRMENAANINMATQGVEDFGRRTMSALSSPIQAGMNFEAVMSKVSAVSLAKERSLDFSAVEAGKTSPKLAAAALDMLTAKAQELGETTSWSATQIGEGMSYLGMAGMTAKQISTSMKGLADLASAGGLDLARAADIASNVGTVFFGNDAAQEMQRTADVFAHTITSYNVDMSMMGETFKYASPQFASMGYSMESLAAATGLL